MSRQAIVNGLLMAAISAAMQAMGISCDNAGFWVIIVMCVGIIINSMIG
jgi:hypothetical protein